MNSKSAQGKQNQTSGLQLERTFPGHADRVHRIAWSPAEEVLATASEDGTLKIWKTDDDRPLQSFDGHTGPLRHVAWSPRTPARSGDRPGHRTGSIWRAARKMAR